MGRVFEAVGAFATASALAVPAFAQGNGHGNAFGHYKNTVASASTSSAASGGAEGPALSGTGVRNFGSWLDDASVMETGDGFVSFGFSLWKTPAYREIDLPTLDSGFAVTRKLQVGMALPYYHASEAGGPVARGVGDLYLNAKYQLRAPTKDRIGIGLVPMVELLSVAPPSGGSRVQWALPVSVERQFPGWRAMGTGGYFSRGAIFGAGAVEIELSERTWATGTMSYSYSTRADELSTALGLTRARTDVSGGLTVALRDDVAVYGSLGRTISARDANSASLIASAGVSFGVKRP